jgi:4-amino-4-deoxy-L-arabinose transferase-like glycosyltransferase
MVHPGYRKRTIFLLIALLLVRFWFGQTFELSGKEAYLWLQGHGTNLSPAYWERGPMVPLLIRIGTGFFGDTELGVRWLAAVICCCTGFVLFYLARHWFNARAAFWTVVLFILIPMYAWKFSFMTEAAVSTGLMALTLLAFCRAIEDDKVWWWLLGGAACGLALLVALPNAWWMVGLLLYFLVSPVRRSRIWEPLLWSTVVFTCLFSVPLLWWWHGSQVDDVRKARLINDWPLSHSLSLNQGFHFIWTEIFYLSPLFFIGLVILCWRLGRQLWEDPRYGLLVCLAVPGLLWQNFSGFFHRGHFELTAPLFLPLVLLAGCYSSRLTNIDRRSRWAFAAILIFAGAQSLAGLNPFYFAPNLDGKGYTLHRTESGENVTGFYASKRQISWRILADQLVRLQQDQGATLIITDLPTTASALSFYLPHNPFIYVESPPDVITHFDFWPHYDESASPNDSALYVTLSNDHPPDDVIKNFASVTALDDPPPSTGFDKEWNIWSCQRFIGSGGTSSANQAPPMHESEALPK